MKAMLVEKGYPLYSEIWSDQPPLFTYLLAASFHFFGFKVGVGRFVVLALSCILLWAAFQFMQRVWGKWQAAAAGLMLFLLPKYMILSVSVMVGLPSITFAMLAMLALSLWHMHRKPMWLALSATSLGLSVLTKLFTGFLAPVFLIGLLIDEVRRTRDQRTWRTILTPAFGWGLIFSLTTLGLGLAMVGPQNVPQLLETHLAATDVTSFQEYEFSLLWNIQLAWPVLFLAGVGTLFAWRSQRWLTLYPAIWSATAFALMLSHRPVWDHHQLLITIPAALPAGLAVYEALRRTAPIIRQHFNRRADSLLHAAALLGVMIFFFVFRTHEPLTLLDPHPALVKTDLEIGPIQEKFLTRMLKYASETKWVVTDLPMYAFRAQLPVPPNLAVFSRKRVVTGNLTEPDVLATIQDWQPEQVLLGRETYPLIQPYLADHYRLILVDDDVRLYVRNDIGR